MSISVRWITLLIRAAVAFAVTGAFLRYGLAIKEDRIVVLAQVIASVSGILLGFMVTSVSVVTAVMNRQLIKNMRKTGHFQRLTSEAFATCILLLATTVITIFALFASGNLIHYLLAVSIFVGVLALLYAIEAARRFSVVIENI